MKTYYITTIEGNTSLLTKKELKAATYGKDYSAVCLGKLTGETYDQKKNDLIEKAKLYQYIDAGGLSYGEFAIICEYFETYGKRFGLLREFKENCII